MDIIDDEGRLFGLVNVIDVLVVLLFLAVVVAGATFVLSTSTIGEEDVRYATVDLGEQPSHVIENLEVGDTMELEASPDNFTVTDVHYGPGEDGHVIIRGEVRGQRIEIGEDRYQFEFGGEVFRAGQELTIETPEYTATGVVRQLQESGETLQTVETQVFTSTTVPAAVAEELDTGDTYTINEESIATIESLQLYPSDAGDWTALIGFTLASHQRGGTAHYGSIPLQIGAAVPFETDGYSLNTTIVERNTITEPGEPGTTQVHLQLENVPPERADSIQEGMTETIADETFAEIVEKSTSPAEVILESDDGDIFLREHPTNLDIDLTVELHTRDTESTLRFHGQEIKEGDTIVLNLGHIIIEAELIAITE